MKDNQPTLRRAVEAAFAAACEADFQGVRHDGWESAEAGHGRREERYATDLYDPPGLPDVWPDATAAVMMCREREAQGRRTSTAHYYLTSHPGTAEELAAVIRGHWDVENGLHWRLDVIFREDRSRIREKHAGANFAIIRRGAITGSCG